MASADASKPRRRPKRVVLGVPSDVVTPTHPREVTLDEFREILVELKGHPTRPAAPRRGSAAAVKRAHRDG